MFLLNELPYIVYFPVSGSRSKKILKPGVACTTASTAFTQRAAVIAMASVKLLPSDTRQAKLEISPERITALDFDAIAAGRIDARPAGSRSQTFSV